MTDDAVQVAELIGEVRKLEGTNSANTRLMKELQGEVVDLNQRLADNTIQLRRRTRNTLVLVFVALVALAAMAGVGIYTARYFSCRNDYTQRFLAAEKAKVAGQIQGIDLLGQNPRAGVTQFKAASQHYLDTIGHINNQC